MGRPSLASLAFASLLCLPGALAGCSDDEASTDQPTAGTSAFAGSNHGGSAGATAAGHAGTSGVSGQGGSTTGGAGGAGASGKGGAGQGGAGSGGAGAGGAKAGSGGAGQGGKGGAGQGGKGGAGQGGKGGASQGGAGQSQGGAGMGGAGQGGAGQSQGGGGTGGQGGAKAHFCDLPLPAAPGLTVPDGYCIRAYTTPQQAVTEARVIRFAPNGDLFIAAPGTYTPGGANGGIGAIVILPDDNHDGLADSQVIFAGGGMNPGGNNCSTHEQDPADLYCVHGLAFADGYLYYTRSDELRRFPYAAGDRTASQGAGELVTTLGGVGLPDIRWTHTVDLDKNGYAYVSRGRQESSTCTDASMGEGAVLGVDVSGALPTTTTVLSDGFRNPMYLRCDPNHDHCYADELSGDGWDGVGGREKLALIKPGEHWGYPCCVAKDKPSPVGTADECTNVGVEQVSVKLHDTPFGLDFDRGSFPGDLKHAAFFAQHGAFASWIGTGVTYVPMDESTGIPAGAPVDFVLGWSGGGTVDGRATDLAFAPDGRLFIIDDTSGGVWWVAPNDLEVPDSW
jgi:glucose/arabinose dehydrogenase